MLVSVVGGGDTQEITATNGTAAALEAQVLLSIPEEETSSTVTPMPMMAKTMALSFEEELESPGFYQVKQNYTRGLWNATLVNLAASKGQITQTEASKILNA